MTQENETPETEETPEVSQEAAEPADAESEASAASSDNPTTDLLKQIEQLQEEKARLSDQLKRTTADFENYRRRVAREKDEIRHRTRAETLETLLPVLDNLEMGLESAKTAQDATSVAKGFEFVMMQFQQILDAQGLETVKPNPGDAFDHNVHEAVAHEPHADVPAECVAKVARQGFKLNGKLLREASVVVSSGPPEMETTEAGSAE